MRMGKRGVVSDPRFVRRPDEPSRHRSRPLPLRNEVHYMESTRFYAALLRSV